MKPLKSNRALKLVCGSALAGLVAAVGCAGTVFPSGPADAGVADATVDVDVPESGAPDALRDGGVVGDVGSIGDAGDAATNGCRGQKGPAMVRFDVPGLGSFCIDRTETTQEQYNEFAIDVDGGAGFAGLPPVCNLREPFPKVTLGRDKLPVTKVALCDAWAYCQWAGKRLCSKIGREDGGHSSGKGDLTNEWVYACANGSKATQFPYSPQYEAGVCNVRDVDAGATSPTSPPGSFPDCHGTGPGFDQVFDMSGNVSEVDDFVSDYSPRDAGSYRTTATRGGAAGFDKSIADCFDPIAYNSVEFRHEEMGFRCCSDVAP